MKQIRVKSPFLDITASNQRREVGDILLVTEERAANLVSGKLCEYVNDDEGKHKDKNPEPQTPATTEPAEKAETPAGEGKKESKPKTTKGGKN